MALLEIGHCILAFQVPQRFPGRFRPPYPLHEHLSSRRRLLSTLGRPNVVISGNAAAVGLIARGEHPLYQPPRLPVVGVLPIVPYLGGVYAGWGMDCRCPRAIGVGAGPKGASRSISFRRLSRFPAPLAPKGEVRVGTRFRTRRIGTTTASLWLAASTDRVAVRRAARVSCAIRRRPSARSASLALIHHVVR